MIKRLLALCIIFNTLNIAANDFENTYYKCTVITIGKGTYSANISIKEAKNMNQYDMPLMINEKELKIGKATRYSFIRNDIIQNTNVAFYGIDVYDSKVNKILSHYEMFLHPKNLKLYFFDSSNKGVRTRVFSCRKPSFFEKAKMMIN